MRLRAVDPGFRPDHALALQRLAARSPTTRSPTPTSERFVRFFDDADGAPRRAARRHRRRRQQHHCRCPATRTRSALRARRLHARRPAPTSPTRESRQVTPAIGSAPWASRVVRGRAFQPSDGPTAPAVAVVNQAWVKQYSPDRDPLGRHRALGELAQREPALGDHRRRHRRRARLRPRPAACAPRSTGRWRSARTRRRWRWSRARPATPLALAGAARGAIAEVDPAQPIFDVMPLDDSSPRSLAQRRFTLDADAAVRRGRAPARRRRHLRRHVATPSRSARRRSASAWRSAPPRAPCSAWSCATA